MLSESNTFSGYSVDNIEAAREFYASLLGLNVAQDEMGLQLRLKNQHVFIYEKPDHQPATFTVLNFIVDHINDAVDKLKANGVVFERYDNLPAEQDERGVLRGLAAGMGSDIAWFKDPAGNVLSILQES